MSSNTNATGTNPALVIVPRSLETAAGQPVSVRAEWVAPAGFEAKGLDFTVTDPFGTEILRVPAGPAADGGFHAELGLNAPITASVTRFAITLRHEGADRPLARGEVEITTRAHKMRLTAWDVPATVTPGAHFDMHIGLVCLAGCGSGGRVVRIVGPDGAVAGTARTGGKVWPGTTALHFAQAAVAAPVEPGLARFRVVIDPDDQAPPHDAGEAAFAVHVMPEGSCDICVEVFAADDHSAARECAGRPASLSGGDG